MGFSRYFLIMVFNICLILRSRGFVISGNTNLLEAAKTFHKLEHLDETEQIVNKRIFCLVCFEDLPELKNGYTIENPEFFDNGFFVCPNNKDSLYCLHCILVLRNGIVSINEDAPIPCPDCRANLTPCIDVYRKLYIRRLFEDFKFSMIENFKMLLFKFDATDILDEIFEEINITIKTCENFLEWIEDSPDDNVVKFRNALQLKLSKLKNLAIDPEHLRRILQEFRNDPFKASITLQREHSHFLSLLEPFQIKTLIRKIIDDIKFIDNSQLIITVIALFDTEFENILQKLAKDQTECFKISKAFLNFATEECLGLFIRLNEFPIRYTQDSLKELFVMISAISRQFKLNPTFLRAAKALNCKLVNLDFEVKDFFTKIPEDIILESEFDFLREFFSESFIFGVLKKYLFKDKTFIKATDFYFENNLYVRFPGWRNGIIESAIRLAFHEKKCGNLSFKNDLKYFMVKINAMDSISGLKSTKIMMLLSMCCDFEISIDFSEPFLSFIDENLFEVCTFDSRDFARFIFKLLNSCKHENIKDYQRFDLSDEFFLRERNLSILFSILEPENIYFALKIICETNKAIENFSMEYRNDLKSLLDRIFYYQEKFSFLNILHSRLPKKFEYLIKLYLINRFITESSGISQINSEFSDDLGDYLLENVTKTPHLIKALKKSLFEYLSDDCFSTKSFCERCSKSLHSKNSIMVSCATFSKNLLDDNKCDCNSYSKNLVDDEEMEKVLESIEVGHLIKFHKETKDDE